MRTNFKVKFNGRIVAIDTKDYSCFGTKEFSECNVICKKCVARAICLKVKKRGPKIKYHQYNSII